MNIYLHEIKSNRKSTLIWAISLALLIALFLSMFPAFTKDIDTTKKLLEGLPDGVKAALDISLDTFFSIFGFYIYILNFVLLAGAVFAMNLGILSTSKEEYGKTADFLMTKPISRNQILTTKILANLTSIIIVDFVFSLCAFLIATTVSPDPFSFKIFVLLTLTLFITQLFFLFVGSLISVILPKIKSAISISLPFVFALFTVSMLESVIGEETVRYITPFKYFDSNYIISHGSYELVYIAIESIIIVTSIILSFIIYNRKDIQAAS